MSSPESFGPLWTNLDDAFLRPPIREMAGVLSVENTGADLHDGAWETMCANVAELADELLLNPDQVQQVLEMHDSSLAAGEGMDWLSIVAHMKSEESQTD